MDVLSGIALAAPAGLNAYIPLLGVAVAQRMGWLELREPFGVMGEWWMILIITALLIVEILADKIPAVDHINDAIQSFVRPAAGGILAVSTTGGGTVSSIAFVAAGVVLAGGVHAAKATARPVVNATTGGAGAPVVSLAEDASAVVLTVLAIVIPVVALLVAVAFFGGAWWALRKARAAKAAT